jgi:hypothetical protein
MVDVVLHDAGTDASCDLRGSLSFDMPSLVGLTGPYLHDGSLPIFEALLAPGHSDGNSGRLGMAELRTSAAFLRTIGPQTELFTIPLGGSIHQDVDIFGPRRLGVACLWARYTVRDGVIQWSRECFRWWRSQAAKVISVSTLFFSSLHLPH